MPGLTAYAGLLDIGQPKAGDTVVVSAATGAVGSVVGQIARISGCRVIGIAGAQEKCRYAVDELGYHACVSHLSSDLKTQLAEACPDGVDVYFENVGGSVFDVVFDRLNVGARMTVCGMISHYNETALSHEPDRLPRIMRAILTRRLKIQGIIVFDYAHRESDFLADVGRWIRNGELRYREDIVDGIDNAVSAFQGLFTGNNFGKLLIRVSEDPTLG
jgi:NADPH-dependent curcumin reductase CurA